MPWPTLFMWQKENTKPHLPSEQLSIPCCISMVDWIHWSVHILDTFIQSTSTYWKACKESWRPNWTESCKKCQDQKSRLFFFLFGRIRAGPSVCGFRKGCEDSRWQETELLLYSASIFVNLNAHWTGENENVYWQERPQVHLKLLENQAAPNNAKFLKLNKLPTWA